MSLLSESMASFTLMIPTATDDGYGGQTTSWEEGESFQAAVAYSTPSEDSRGDRLDIHNKFTVITSRDVTLAYGDYIVRADDGMILKVTADGLDRKTPASAGLDMRAVTAEEMEGLPT